MSLEPNQVPPVLQEIRQRRVGKVVVAYLAVAFAGVEASASFLPALSAPEWVGRVILGAFVLGFPAAVVLSWTYDLTPRGVVRTPDDLTGVPESPPSFGWLVLSIVSVAAGLALHLARG